MQRRTKRLVAALLLIGPAIVIAAVFVTLPKASTPRDEAPPEGLWDPVAVATVTAGNADHPASGSVVLLRNGTGNDTRFVFRFEDYEARAGPNVWFHLVGDEAAIGSGDVEDGLRLPVPGPGQATYRGTFNVPAPEGFDLEAHDVVVAWCRTFNEPFARAVLEGSP